MVNKPSIRPAIYWGKRSFGGGGRLTSSASNSRLLRSSGSSDDLQLDLQAAVDLALLRPVKS